MIYGRSSCNPIMTWANFWIIDSWDALGSCQRPCQFLHGPPATKLVLAMGGMSWSSSDGVKQLKTLRSFERCLATSYIFTTSSHWILLKYIQHAIGLVPCHAMPCHRKSVLRSGWPRGVPWSAVPPALWAQAILTRILSDLRYLVLIVDIDINRPLYIGDYRYIDIFDFLSLPKWNEDRAFF